MENVQFLKLDFNVIEDINLNAYDFRVYTLLMKYYNVDKDMAYPSQKTIAEKLNISLSTVKKSIKRLIDLEYIKVDKKKAIKGNYNTYKIKHIILSVKEAIRKGTKVFKQAVKNKNEVIEPLKEVINKIKEAPDEATSEATNINTKKNNLYSSKQYYYNKTSYSSQQSTSYNNYNNKKKTLKFMNFDQRTYDYDELERKLLGWE